MSLLSAQRYTAPKVLLLVAGTLLSVSACSLPSVSMSRLPGTISTSQTSATARAAAAKAAAAKAAAAKTAASATPVDATKPVVKAKGTLDAGSATHILAAGSRKLVVDYWTTQKPQAWTTSTPATIQLSAHIEGGGSKNAVKVTRFVATINGTSLTDDRGEFVITPPFSYGTALQVPTTPAGTRTAVITVQFDLLVETAPGSKAFFRQTVLDTLTIAYASKDNA